MWAARVPPLGFRLFVVITHMQHSQIHVYDRATQAKPVQWFSRLDIRYRSAAYHEKPLHTPLEYSTQRSKIINHPQNSNSSPGSELAEQK